MDRRENHDGMNGMEDEEIYQDIDDTEHGYIEHENMYGEDFVDEYYELPDGSMVPVNQVQDDGMRMMHPGPSGVPMNNQHFPDMNQRQMNHNTQSGSTMFAIRGSQMYRMDKVPPPPRQPVYKYSSIGSNKPNYPDMKSTYNIGEPSVSAPKSFAPYGAYNNVQVKSEFNTFSPASSYMSAEKPAPKSKRKQTMGQRKPCNCTKSMCLKLYCDCFANGEFCRDCNCKDCHNNLEHEADRTRAIKQSLERNPNAFKPKIGVTKAGQTDIERLHQKGCHCKKSGCLKNYCECYEAKVPCTDRCKCKGCQNTEHDRAIRYKDKVTNSALMNLANAATASLPGPSNSRPASPITDESDTEQNEPDPRSYPWFYMTDEVIEAATLCMVAQSEEALSKPPDGGEASIEDIERLILREFGRCLEQIITSAST